MLPSSRSRPPIRTMDLMMRLAVIFMVSWFLYTAISMQKMVTGSMPLELKSASKALDAGDTNLARSRFDGYLAAHPGSPDAFRSVCTICEQLHRPDLTIPYTQRGLHECTNAASVDRARLYLLLADALSESGKNQAMPARAAAHQALSLAPDDPDILNAVGYILADTGTNRADLDEAEALIARAIKELNGRVGMEDQSGQLADFEDSYGWVLYKQGLYGPAADAQPHFRRAVTALLQAIDDMPSPPSVETARVLYYHLAAAFHKVGQIDEARNAIRVALSYDSQYAEAIAEQRALTVAPPPPLSSVGAPPSGLIAKSGAQFTLEPSRVHSSRSPAIR